MTTIVSRVYETVAGAEAALAALQEADATSSGATLITSDGGDTAARIAALDVEDTAAAIYAGHVERGSGVVVVRAEFAPIGTAQRVMEIMDAASPLSVGVQNENRYLRIEPKNQLFNSILADHPKFLTFSEGGRKRGLMSAVFGMKTLSKRSSRRSVLSGAPFMSTKLIPIPLLDKPRKRTSASTGTITSAFMPMVSRS